MALPLLATRDAGGGWGKGVGPVGTVGTVGTVDTVGTVGTVDTVGTVGTVGAVHCGPLFGEEVCVGSWGIPGNRSQNPKQPKK